MRRRALLAAGVVAVLLAVVFALPPLRHIVGSDSNASGGATGTPSASVSSGGTGGGQPQTMAQPTPSMSTAPAPVGPRLVAPANPASVTASGTSLFEWALLDRPTGQVTGSAQYKTKKNTVESMIKPGIASDWLRRQAEAGKEPTKANLSEITAMIIDSDDRMAEKYYQLGGADAVIKRLINICGLTDVELKSGLWSWSLMTTQDMIRYGACVADGRAAGPKWTTWMLDTMKQVRGDVPTEISHDGEGGRWGIIDGLPADLAKNTSIKNGWTLYRADGWHVNCLAINPTFVLAIEIRTTRNLPAAANICKATTQKMVVKPAA